MRKIHRKLRRAPRDMSLAFHESRFEVGAPDHGARLDGFLSRHLRWRSRTSIQRAIGEGRIEVRSFKDPQRATVAGMRSGLRLRRGQEVVVRLDAPRVQVGDQLPGWCESRCVVIFEDHQILAVAKPPHLSVYPSRRHRGVSLIELVHARHRELFGAPRYAPALCHRLDRETTGLVLFAKSRDARSQLGLQFETRGVEKTYLALVMGEVEGDRGEVSLPLGPAQDSVVEIKSGPRQPPVGRTSRTLWRVRRRLRDRTLLELSPVTGRHHQLRAHMKALGHPIVGDKLYLGGDDLFLRSLAGALTRQDERRLGLGHQALHAWCLEFAHPEDGRHQRLEAPLWADVAASVSAAETDDVAPACRDSA
ncbi:MAG: RluA family pseudouridine synthase [Acidobacteriota bacterium]|nr:RluA family pseudouridine synthase [Acidobacteriota bacterium]